MCKRQITPRTRAVLRMHSVIALALIVALALTHSGLRRSVLAHARTQTLTVTASFSEGQSVPSSQAIELQLGRPVEKSEGRIAVFIGSSDLTSLFTQSESRLRYNPKVIPMPLGESVLTVYLISPAGEWKEIARFTIKVSNDAPAKQSPAEGPPVKKAPASTEQLTRPESKSDEQKPATADNNAEQETKKEPSKPAESTTADKPASEHPAAKLQQAKKDSTKPGDQPTTTDKPASEAPANKPADNPPSTDQPKPETNSEAAPNAQPAAAPQDQKPPAKKFGFDKLNFIPALTLTIKSQPAQSNFPAANRPDRATFTDLNMTGSFKTELTRGAFSSQTQWDFAGSSFQNEALRFGELGNKASNVDLASYLTQYQLGKAKYILGNTSYGSSRHLVNSFSSRGMTLAMPLSPRFDVSFAAMNGSAVVGFDNFLGLAKRRHQLLAGTLGVEFLPKRPGGFRLETAVMEGWLLPISGFNQGVVNDAERSKGIGLRLLASDPKQRFRFEAGLTRSQFVNPLDAALNQGQRVVEVRPLWKNAQFVDAAYDIFKDFALTKQKKLNLTFTFKHERIDPLYKSLGASTQADKINNEFLVNGSIGEITAQFAHQRFNDNLANIPSILKSNTRVNTFSFAVPLATVLATPEKPSTLLPRLSYNFNQTYQFVAAAPINGGFEIDAATVPNQISTNQGITADWQFKKWKLAYRANHSFQNNRQKGNELADLSNLTNGVTVGINPSPVIDLAVDFNAENAFDKRQNTTTRNFTLAPNVTWRVTKKMSFVSNVSFNLAGDVADTKNDRNINFDLQYSYQFAKEKDRFRKVSGQFSIKYTNTFARSQNFLIPSNDLKKNQTLFTQLSFTFF